MNRYYKQKYNAIVILLGLTWSFVSRGEGTRIVGAEIWRRIPLFPSQ